MLILCVDDDQPVRSVIGDMIRKLGHHVIEAEDGPSALRGLARFGRAVDVMMTDIRMPGMTGFNLVRQALKHHPRMGIIYTTGFCDGPASPGVTLLKPCTVAQLDRAINLVEAGARNRRSVVEAKKQTSQWARWMSADGVSPMAANVGSSAWSGQTASGGR